MEQGFKNLFFLLLNFHLCILSNRTSTIILVRRDQTGLFIEKTLSNPLIDPTKWTVNTWNFKLYNVNEPPVLLN